MSNFLYFIKKYILFVEGYNHILELNRKSSSDIYYKNICLLSNLNILTQEIIKNTNQIVIQEFQEYKDFLNTQKINYFSFIQSSIRNELQKLDISKINLTEPMLNIESLVPTTLTVYCFSNNSMCKVQDRKNKPLSISEINDCLTLLLNTLKSNKKIYSITNQVKLDAKPQNKNILILEDDTNNSEELDYI